MVSYILVLYRNRAADTYGKRKFREREFTNSYASRKGRVWSDVHVNIAFIFYNGAKRVNFKSTLQIIVTSCYSTESVSSYTE